MSVACPRPRAGDRGKYPRAASRRGAPGPRRLFSAAALLAVASLTACTSSTSSADSSSGKLPNVIYVASIRDMTGLTAFAGTLAVKGAETAIAEINQTHYLGNAKLSMDIQDPASNPQTAASLASQDVASKKYAAILGPILSSEAIAMGPIVQKGKLPDILTESSAAGVLAYGDYTWRATPPYTSYFDIMGKYLESKGVKTIAVLYDSSVTSYPQTAATIKSTWPKEFGITEVAARGVTANTQDFTAPVQALLGSKPQAVAFFLLSTANATAIQQFRQAGFSGPAIATSAAGTGNLTGAGAAGKGVAWPSDFNALQENEETQHFVALYKAEFHSVPNPYAAEGYDAAWFLARAIKAADSANPVMIEAALSKVAREGFTGAEGKIIFDGNDARLATPIVVEWNGTEEVPASR